MAVAVATTIITEEEVEIIEAVEEGAVEVEEVVGAEIAIPNNSMDLSDCARNSPA